MTVELAPRLDYAPAGDRERRLDEAKLLRRLQAVDFPALHDRVMAKPMPWRSRQVTSESLDRVVPGEVARVLERANSAMDGWVCLLGSGPVQLGRPEAIRWNRDFTSSLDWPLDYFSRLDPNDREGRPEQSGGGKVSPSRVDRRRSLCGPSADGA